MRLSFKGFWRGARGVNVPEALLHARTDAQPSLSLSGEGLEERSPAGVETLQRLGNFFVSLNFYLFPRGSPRSINRNVPSAV